MLIICFDDMTNSRKTVLLSFGVEVNAKPIMNSSDVVL